ncbi:hypothetical protein Agub_g2155, partial [Astrephomene gubernaculifera]
LGYRTRPSKRIVNVDTAPGLWCSASLIQETSLSLFACKACEVAQPTQNRLMEPHSLALITASTLDPRHHSHLHGTHARRAQPLPLQHNLRRPFKGLAQSLARLLPQLRQISQRLRRIAPNGTADGNPVRPLRTAVANVDPDACTAPDLSFPAPTLQTQIQPKRLARWRACCRVQFFRLRNRQLDHCQKQQRKEQEEQQQQPLQQRVEEQQDQQQLDAPSHGPCTQVSVHPLHRHAHGTQRYGPLRQLRRVLRLMGSQLRPVGPGGNDRTVSERLLNVATCGMFFQAGGKIVRLCSSLAARRFGWAFIAVGAIATLYHGSVGRLRPLARKVDYYSIALASLLLRAAVVGPAPRWLGGVMLAATPFRPTLVSGCNFMAVEEEHTPLLAWFPFTHAAFHTLSAAAFLTLPSALDHITASAAA